MKADLQATHEKLTGGGRILLSRLRHIGDVVLSLPLVQGLKEIYPRAEIDYLADAVPLEVLEGHPDIRRTWPTPHGLTRTLRMLRHLRRQKYDCVVDLYSNPRSAFITRAIGAACSLGEARRVRRHLYTIQRHLPPGRSALLQHFGVCEEISGRSLVPGPPRLYLDKSETAAARHYLEESGNGAKVLLHVDATQEAKEWPTENLVGLSQRLLDAGYTLWIGRSPKRCAASHQLAQHLSGKAHYLPPMSLRRYLGLVSQMQGVVSVDGGIVHAAVALERPLLALFGPTDPGIWFPYEKFGPYRVLHAGVDCSGCDRVVCADKRCMSAIGVAEVWSQFEILLQQTAASNSTGE